MSLEECIKTESGYYLRGGVTSTRYDKNAERIAMENKLLTSTEETDEVEGEEPQY